MIIHADKDSPRANGEGWHSDVSCDPEPPMGSILYIKKCPPRGGDTLFANMYAAYEALSDRMKTYLEGLTARHNGEHYRGQYANYGVKDKESYPHADHPVVRTHPVTGKKALYVNQGFTRYINGIPRDESDGILRYLYEHMANPLFQCRFRWQENSIAFWDNRCVQHHAMWDYWPHTRSRQPRHGQGRPAGLGRSRHNGGRENASPCPCPCLIFRYLTCLPGRGAQNAHVRPLHTRSRVPTQVAIAR